MSIKFKKIFSFFIFFISFSFCAAAEDGIFFQKRGIVQFENEMYSFAEESFAKAVRLNSSDYVSCNYLAKISIIKGNRIAALQYYMQSLEIKNDQDGILFSAGEIYDYLGDGKKALQLFEESLRFNPENNLALIGAARQYSIKGDFLKSSGFFQKAFDLKISQSAPYFNSGTDYIRKNDFRNAVEKLKRCIEINPAHIDAYYELSQYYRYTGKNTKALDLLEKVKYLQPHLEKPYVQIAYIYYTVRLKGNYRDRVLMAEKNIKKAIELNDKNPDYWEFLSELYNALDMYEESKKAGDEAFRLSREKSSVISP